MPDRDDRLLDLDDDVDAYEDDWEPAPRSARCPPRPRRRLVTPASAALAAVLIAAARASSAASRSRRARPTARRRGRRRRRRAGGARRRRRRGAAGGARRLRRAAAAPRATRPSARWPTSTAARSTSRTATATPSASRRRATRRSTARRSTSVGAIHPGDTVIVQGTKSAGGTITATQINATSSSAASGLAGLFGGGRLRRRLRGGEAAARVAAARAAAAPGRASAGPRRLTPGPEVRRAARATRAGRRPPGPAALRSRISVARPGGCPHARPGMARRMFFDGFALERIDVGEAVLRVRHGGSGPPLAAAPRPPAHARDLASRRAAAGDRLHGRLPRPARLRRVHRAADDARPRAVLQARDGARRAWR